MITENVLILDDSLTVRMDLEAAFTAAGYQVFSCGTLKEARKNQTRTPFDVIVLDVFLPDGDGVTLLQEIRTAAGGIAPVVLMLATAAELKARLDGLEITADEFIGKPYDIADLLAKTRKRLDARHARVAPSTATILIIDDNAAYRERLRTACEQAGYAVLVAASGEDGLRMAAESRPQAILVSGVMTGIDGVTVIRRVRLDAVLQQIPCLLLTASQSDGVELRALDAGADAFVRKEEDSQIILARLTATLQQRASTSTTDSSALPGTKLILAVDDSTTYRHALADTLKEDGFDVVLASSGEEALEILVVQAVDCILLDLLMPGLGGQEICRRIKSTPAFRDIPLIMLTAIEDNSAMLDGLGAGADDFIAKSSEWAVLRARVHAQIRRKQFQDENRRIREELLQKEIEEADNRLVRKLAESRAVLIEELELKNKDLETFSYSVAHDLRAPLRHIVSYAAILKSEIVDRLDARETQNLANISNSAEKMARLIEDLLVFSHNGRVELRKQKVSLQKLVADAREELQPDIGLREVDWMIEELPDVNGDEALLKQVCLNLLSNAIKYTRSRKKALIAVGCHCVGSEVECFVRDNGAGFDMKHSGKLFGVFQRLHRASEFEGTGIGLANVRRIIERHGGRTWAEGVVGQGATVHFSLPAFS